MVEDVKSATRIVIVCYVVRNIFPFVIANRTAVLRDVGNVTILRDEIRMAISEVEEQKQKYDYDKR